MKILVNPEIPLDLAYGCGRVCASVVFLWWDSLANWCNRQIKDDFLPSRTARSPKLQLDNARFQNPRPSQCRRPGIDIT